MIQIAGLVALYLFQFYASTECHFWTFEITSCECTWEQLLNVLWYLHTRTLLYFESIQKLIH